MAWCFCCSSRTCIVLRAACQLIVAFGIALLAFTDRQVKLVGEPTRTKRLGLLTTAVPLAIDSAVLLYALLKKKPFLLLCWLVVHTLLDVALFALFLIAVVLYWRGEIKVLQETPGWIIAVAILVCCVIFLYKIHSLLAVNAMRSEMKREHQLRMVPTTTTTVDESQTLNNDMSSQWQGYKPDRRSKR